MLEIKIADKKDAVYAGILHCKYMPWGFLSSFGAEYLKFIYEALSSFPGGVLLIAVNDGRAVGFAAGVTSTKEFYKFFLKRYLIKALPYIIKGMRRPTDLRKATETFLYGCGTQKDRNLPKAELLAIAVADDYQRAGAATLLFGCLKDWFRQKGIKEFKTSTGNANIKGSGFFTSMGGRMAGEIRIHKNERSNSFIYETSI